MALKTNAAGAVERILVVECKATTRIDGTAALSRTNHGRQLEHGWVAKKMNNMYQQGGALRDSAVLMRANMDKVRSVVAFQKRGHTNWANQAKTPKFDATAVERLLEW